MIETDAPPPPLSNVTQSGGRAEMVVGHDIDQEDKAKNAKCV